MTATTSSAWDRVIGQDKAVEQLRRSAHNPVHAYLLVGPEGCGTEEASIALAAVLLSGTDDPSDRAVSLALRGVHPDMHHIRREGASILVEQADEIIRLASTTATEGRTKVIIIDDVHLMAPVAAARLLKTIEEPPPGVYFIALAEQVTDGLVTIASRCVTVHFGEIPSELIVSELCDKGIDINVASVAARSAHGSISRALLLANDSQLVHRREVFAGIPQRIDGTGATVAALVEEVLALIDSAAEPLQRRHEQEVADHEHAMSIMGVKRGGKRALEDRHRRELRRHRTDELRAGLSEIASVYRDEIGRTAHLHRPEAYVQAISRLHAAMRALALNVNEAILLRDLFWSLPSPSSDAALQFLVGDAS